MKKQILLAAVLSASTLPALAEGFYVAGDIGESKIQFDIGDDYSLSKTDTTYSLGIGFDINKFFAVEVGFRDLGTLKEDGDDYDFSWSTKLDTTAIQASVVGKLPVSDVFDIYGRLGFAKLDMDYKYSEDNGYRESSSESENKAFFGVGASYSITPEFAIRAEYNQYAKIDDLKLSALTVGATYRF